MADNILGSPQTQQAPVLDGDFSAYPVAPELLPTQVLAERGYEVRFARSAEELDQVLRLRFEIFNLELGEGLSESYESGRDVDEFDAVCHHLIVVEQASGDIVGTYRLQTSSMANRHRGFYSTEEFDLSELPQKVIDDSVELGRACVAKEHRSTSVLFLLWKGLALYVATNQCRFLFGCSSLTSQNPAEGLAMLRQMQEAGHLHPEFSVTPQPEFECVAEKIPQGRQKVPTLFRIYLRHGAKILGPPALDHRFKTIDFLVLFDVGAMDPKMFQTFFG